MGVSVRPHTHMKTFEEMQSFLESNRYNPAILPELEEYVSATVVTERSDLDANLALLKFYQLDPSKSNVRIVTNILVKALTQLPNSDFNLCLYLIPASVQGEESITNLMLLANLLESCDFAKFWETSSKMEVLKAIPGFFDAIRRFIIVTLSISYSCVPKAFLCETLNVPLSQLKATIGAEGFAEYFESFDDAADTVPLWGMTRIGSRQNPLSKSRTTRQCSPRCCILRR